MNEKFYLSTAIAYTSSKPHIGNVYEAILADAICRFKRKEGFDVYFQTGTDEHGQKIEDKAKAAGISPKEHVDVVSGALKTIYKEMNVSYDAFVRTTDDYHEKKVQDIFEKLLKQGDIYKGYYKGWYCKSCESFYTEKDLVDGKCPTCGGEVELTSEEAYFFKLSKYQDRLMKHINAFPHFIEPESRKNEMVNNFLQDEIPDLCVTRSSFSWGIPVKSDPKHVIYVWIDALANYITKLGYNVDGENDPKFNEYWPADVHIIGKDILRFHTIIWPILLMALDLPLPKQIFAHPWILMNNDKMSKSKGNIIYADDLCKVFGVDAVRYYVLHEIPFAQDGNLTYELVGERTNSDLANTLGNLVNRTIAMVKKYFGGTVSYHGSLNEFDKELEELSLDTYKKVKADISLFKVTDATEHVMKLLRRANKYVDENEPWILARDESKSVQLENCLFHLLETIRFSATLLEAFIPSTSEKIYKQINTKNTSFDSLLKYGETASYTVGEASVLFARLDMKQVMQEVTEKTNSKKVEVKPEKKEKIKENLNTSIDFSDFEKIELVVGEIVTAKKHPKADKLLVFDVNIGTETRQIVSGIAAYYKPEELVGKKVVVVKNLKPIKLRGEKSSGMLLCASNSDDSKLELVTIANLNPGDQVS